MSKLIAKREKKLEKIPQNGGKRTLFDPEDKVQDGGCSQRISNPNIADSCKLKDGELHKYIFNPGNIRGFEKPVNKNGNQMCLRFQCSVLCIKDYKFTSGHGNIDGE